MSSRVVLLGGCVALLLVGAAVGYFYGISSAPTRTTTTTSTAPAAYDQVASAYANQLLLLNSRNISGLVSGYEGNATVVWEGRAAGLTGTYVNSTTIGETLSVFLTRYVVSSLVSNETQTISLEGGHWVVNSSFDLTENSTVYGRVDATISAQDSYVHVGDTWLIAKETWNFLKLDLQYPVQG